MSVLSVLVVLVVLAVLALAVPAVLAYAGGNDKRRELRLAKQTNRIAVKALTAISRDAGNPALEAQIALDEITALEDSNYIKELN